MSEIIERLDREWLKFSDRHDWSYAYLADMDKDILEQLHHRDAELLKAVVVEIKKMETYPLFKEGVSKKEVINKIQSLINEGKSKKEGEDGATLKKVKEEA